MRYGGARAHTHAHVEHRQCVYPWGELETMNIKALIWTLSLIQLSRDEPYNKADCTVELVYE